LLINAIYATNSSCLPSCTDLETDHATLNKKIKQSLAAKDYAAALTTQYEINNLELLRNEYPTFLKLDRQIMQNQKMPPRSDGRIL